MGTDLQVRRDEAGELVRLAADEVVGAIDSLHSIHGSIAQRVFARTGPGGAPAQWMHDTVSGAVYGGMKGSARGLGLVAGGALARRPRVISNTPRGAALVAAITGLIGDTLERRESALHQPMALRVGGDAI